MATSARGRYLLRPHRTNVGHAFLQPTKRNRVFTAAAVAATTSAGVLGSPTNIRAASLAEAAAAARTAYGNPFTEALKSAGIIIDEPTGAALGKVVGVCAFAWLIYSLWNPGEWVPFASEDTKFLAKIKGPESLMSPKAHGTAPKPPMRPLRWSVDWDITDKICCFNRKFAERSGYWLDFLPDLEAEIARSGTVTFCDPVTGKPLFIAPKGRSWDDFVVESKKHGWPSFRDAEVVTENVRLLSDGETVSSDGTHLGHNLPDYMGACVVCNVQIQ